jgi:hypothetical protein
MAQKRKDLLGRLADAGEDALGKLGKAPGVDSALGFATSSRERLDELTKKVRGIDALERRVARLEKRLDEVTGSKGSPAKRKPTTRKTSTPKSSPSTPKSSTAKTGPSSPG